jgi:hypothetical protein
MMEAVRTSETSAKFNVTTRRYIPEDSKLEVRFQVLTVVSMKTAFVWDAASCSFVEGDRSLRGVYRSLLPKRRPLTPITVHYFRRP